MSGENLLPSSPDDLQKCEPKNKTVSNHLRANRKKYGCLIAVLVLAAVLTATYIVLKRKQEPFLGNFDKFYYRKTSPDKYEWDMQCDAGFSVSKSVIAQWNGNRQAATFQVEKVQREKPAFENSSLTAIGKGLEYYWKHERHEKIPLVFETGQVNHKDLVQSSEPLWHDSKYRHAFISTVVLAFNHHVPLVLSPDDFWLMISLAVGQFLGGHKDMAEKYRHKFVEHNGTKELKVFVNKYGIVPKNPEANLVGWPNAVEEMSVLIGNETSSDLAEIMTSPFSSSGQVEMMVMRVTLMETMRNYFTYGFYLLCGIPEITLEGSPDDYRSIIDRIDRLAEILPDFQWYLNRVRILMIKIHESRLGNVDQEWWREMVSGHQRNRVCTTTTTFTGWLAQFVAFTRNGKGEYISTEGNYKMKFHECCGNPAVTITDFFLHDGLYTMKRYNMKLAAGFMGTALARNGTAIRPAIGWATFYWKEKYI